MTTINTPTVSRVTTNVFLGMTVLAILSASGAVVTLIGVFL